MRQSEKRAVNPNIIPKAQQLLDYLMELSVSDRKDKKLIVAHWVGAPINPAVVEPADCDDAYFTFREIEEFYLQTGKRIGMVECWTECSWTPDDKYNRLEDCMWYTSMTRGMLDFAQSGGIVKMGSSFLAPLEEGVGSRWARDVKYEDLLKPDSSTHKSFVTICSRIADFFEVLQGKEIPIIYRPFTEAYLQNHFWYDHSMPDDIFVAVWQWLYSYFTIERGLNNILWDFNDDRTSTRYPGDGYVDIFHGRSVYRDMEVTGQCSNSLPWAQGELGFQEDYYQWLEQLKKISPETSYVLVWDRGWGPRGHEKYIGQGNCTNCTTYNTSYNQMLTDDYVITLEDIRLWER